MRNGIHCAGNFLIDHIKIIDRYPAQGMLANIQDECIGTGGGPYNALIDLAKFKVDLPLFATGIVGDDADGAFILKDLQQHHIDTTSMHTTSARPTSYTLVMTEKDTGYRTFFHNRGANALLDYQHFVDIRSDAKIFYLAYLLLLDRLDSKDDEYGVVAARVLDMLQQKGYKTAVDLISEDSERYQKIVTSCLKYINYLILNEIEAGKTAGIDIRDRDGKIVFANLTKASQILFALGVNDLVVIHFPEGGFAANSQGDSVFVPSYFIDESEIRGTAGAGDAFCAGMLYGIHQGFALEHSLKIANASARFNLTSPTCTGGAVPLKTLSEFIKHTPPTKKSEAIID